MSSITRRRALGTSLTAILGAGAASVLPHPAVAAQQAIAPSLDVANVDLDGLLAESRRLLAEHLAAREHYRALSDQLDAMLTPEQCRLAVDLDDAHGEYLMSGHDLHLAEMARHAPALATLLHWLNRHAVGETYDAVATCCTPQSGYYL